VAPGYVFALNKSVVPAHIGVFTVKVGVVPAPMMAIFFEPTEEVHPATTMYRVYVPLMAAVALGRVGAWPVAVQPPGPAHT